MFFTDKYRQIIIQVIEIMLVMDYEFDNLNLQKWLEYRQIPMRLWRKCMVALPKL
jgi:hypothetical protein